jgi:adenylate cyclase
MRLVRTILRSSPFALVAVSVLVCAGILGLRAAGSLQALELGAYDWLIRVRGASQEDPRIVLISINDEYITKAQWPVPDAVLAQALSTILECRPAAIGLDLYRDKPEPPGTDDLDQVLAHHPQIIAVTKFREGGEFGTIAPPAVLKDTEQVGFNDLVVDPGGRVRRGLLFLDDGERVYYSLALRLALCYLQPRGIVPQPDSRTPQCLRLGTTTIRPFEAQDGGYINADAGGYQFLLDYRVSEAGVACYPFAALLDKTIASEALRDKIVLIGTVAESAKDFFYTPLSEGSGRQIPGVALHAQIVSQLLRFGLDGAPVIKSGNEASERLWILLWSVLGGMIGLQLRSLGRFILAAASGLVILGGASYGALAYGATWIPLVPPAFAWFGSASVVTAYRSTQEKKQRSLMMQLFSRHLSKEIAEEVWKERDQFLDGRRPRPQRLTATVLFSDLVGFTSISEKLSPSALMEWLNHYMEAMSEVVIRHGGVINKYIGDSIMAVFGVPVARKDEGEIARDAENAVRCALAMEQRLVEMNSAWEAQGHPTIGMRIGIFTGPLVAGSLGGKERLEYTVIGDTVNTASRLEGYAKEGVEGVPLEGSCRILIGESTHQYLQKGFVTHRIGEVSLKGKDHKIHVYRVDRNDP